MLAVVQMVYLTIKSGVRLCREIPVSEIQTWRTPNGVGEQATKGREGKNKRKARRWVRVVELSALSLTVSSLHSSELRVSFFSFLSSFADFLMPTPSFTLPSLSLPLSVPNSPSNEWPKKEMCLCLDFRQIICGNKFLCV